LERNHSVSNVAGILCKFIHARCPIHKRHVGQFEPQVNSRAFLHLKLQFPGPNSFLRIFDILEILEKNPGLSRKHENPVDYRFHAVLINARSFSCI